MPKPGVCPFVRAPSISTRNSDFERPKRLGPRQSGLGLPLTKALVELHGGSLDLQSQSNVGTTVTVHFPAERVSSPTASAPILAADGKTKA